ncbi:MAG: hypothetical protein LBK99_18600 [Opitutaceae bacterium]|nr:hypothetical protein [Opitutaceae bacterium]
MYPLRHSATSPLRHSAAAGFASEAPTVDPRAISEKTSRTPRRIDVARVFPPIARGRRSRRIEVARASCPWTLPHRSGVARASRPQALPHRSDVARAFLANPRGRREAPPVSPATSHQPPRNTGKMPVPRGEATFTGDWRKKPVPLRNTDKI